MNKGCLLSGVATFIWMCAASMATAAPRIRNCLEDSGCRELPTGSKLLAGVSAVRPSRRAANLLLAAEAQEMATWSNGSVLVVSDLPIRMPPRHRSVLSLDLGERALLVCGADEYLQVVRTGEVRRSRQGTIFVDLAIESFGATCNRSDRQFFRHGECYYRVALRRRGFEVRWILKVSD